MTIKAVVFDFGGVLVRSQNIDKRIEWEQRMGMQRGELDRLVFDSDIATRASVGEFPVDAVWEHVGKSLQLAPADLDTLREDFFEGDALDTELVAFLKSMRPRYKTAILSNAWSNARELFAETFGLHEAVDMFIISAEEGLAKPDPRIYTLLAERLGVRPEEIIFLDDFIRNIDAARAAGIHAVHFTDTGSAMAEIRAILQAHG